MNPLYTKSKFKTTEFANNENKGVRFINKYKTNVNNTYSKNSETSQSTQLTHKNGIMKNSNIKNKGTINYSFKYPPKSNLKNNMKSNLKGDTKNISNTYPNKIAPFHLNKSGYNEYKNEEKKNDLMNTRRSIMVDNLRKPPLASSSNRLISQMKKDQLFNGKNGEDPNVNDDEPLTNKYKNKTHNNNSNNNKISSSNNKLHNNNSNSSNMKKSNIYYKPQDNNKNKFPNKSYNVSKIFYSNQYDKDCAMSSEQFGYTYSSPVKRKYDAMDNSRNMDDKDKNEMSYGKKKFVGRNYYLDKNMNDEEYSNCDKFGDMNMSYNVKDTTQRENNNNNNK